MSKTGKPLIIAEKPSAARAIAEALGGFARREGYLESSEFCLSWAIGHLVELKAPEEYDPRWKRWSLETLPIMPGFFDLKVAPKTKAQFDVLARLIRQAPLLINACDAAREGELIFRYICQMARATQPARRLWVSSLTSEAIRKAFADLRPEQEYERLYQSALCRAQGDWLVGMNATRAFTVKWDELLPVGRVQTPTLALLVRRELEIEAFRPEQYWEVFAEFDAGGGRRYRGKYFGQDGDRLKQAAEAEAIAARTKGQPGVIESAEEKPTSERPPQLFDLTALQREANKRFALTAAATLKAAQSLYEAKLITYPRTDSRYLTKDIVKTLPGIVKAAGAQAEFRQAAAGADLSLVHPGARRVVDDSKVSDHHAIIPTAEIASGLAAVEAKVYGLIVRRFLAQFYPDARYLETEVITRVGSQPDRFRSRGRRVLDPGWRAVEPEWQPAAAKPARGKKAGAEADGADEEAREARTELPRLSAGEPVVTKDAKAEQKETQPPRRYSEAALLGAMETAGKSFDDDALKEAMKGHGLGTPATRASIIERLKDVGYVTPEKKSLVPTPKGRRLVELAEQAGAQVLLSAELTGEWEKRIADIQAGAYQPERFHAEIRGLALQVVDLVRASTAASAGGRAASEGTAGAGARGRGKAASGTRAAGGSGGGRGRRSATAAVADQADERAADGGGSGFGPDAGLAGFGSDAGAGGTPFAGMVCPRCGRAIIKGSKAYVCANNDCAVRIPTWLCGKVIDTAHVSALLTKGKTRLIAGFRSTRTGNTFSAYLVLKDGQVGFEFPPDKPRKSSGYRRSNTGGTAGEPTAATETRSRTTRSRSGGTASTSRSGASRARMGRGASGSSESARTGPRRG
jgi:DNA topoisomerase-3